MKGHTMKKVTKIVASLPFARTLILSGISLSLVLLQACSEEGGGREKITSRTPPTSSRTTSTNPQKGLGEIAAQVCDDKEIFNLNLMLDKMRTDGVVSNQAARITTFDLRVLTADSDILNGKITDASETLNADILLHSGLSYQYGLAKDAIATEDSQRFNVTEYKECESYTLGEQVFTVDLERSNPDRLVLISGTNIRVYTSPSDTSLEAVEYEVYDSTRCGNVQPIQIMSSSRLELNNGSLKGVEISSNLLGLLFRHILLSSQVKEVAQDFLNENGLPLTDSGINPVIADVDYLELSSRLSVAEAVNGTLEKSTDFKLEACE